MPTINPKLRLFVINILFFSVAAGQLIRFQVFPGASVGLTIVDVVTILLAICLLVWGLKTRQFVGWAKELWRQKAWRFITIFLGFALISLFLHFQRYPAGELLIAFSYWLRLFLIYALAALLVFGSWLSDRRLVVNAFLGWSAVLLVLGYLQLIFVGNFAFMAKFGWDPHVGRMLSSFFDPNFFGAYLVLVMAVLALQITQATKKTWLVIFFIAAWLGLYLTFSRSAWITGAIAVPLALWPKNWKFSLVILALFVALAFLPGRLGSRFQFGTTLFSKGVLSGQIKGKKSNVNDVASQGADASGAARILSFRKGWELVKTSPIIGVGYNAYGSALVKAGLADSASLETRSGYFSDSSLLNVLVTTGLVGLGLYLAFYWQVLRRLARAWCAQASPLTSSLLGFTVAWLVGSFFNNTLLYIFILLPWLILWGANGTEAIE